MSSRYFELEDVVLFVTSAAVLAIMFSRKERKEQLTSLPSYKRQEFTSTPAFGEEYIVGNLNEIVHDIENKINDDMKSGKNIKESCPFYCLINPPRHGKSLFLDRLFLTDEDVIVLGITYNSTTGLVEGELENPGTAIKWFWIRVLKSMLQIPDELETLSNLLQPGQCSWSYVKSLIISGLSSSPFLDKNGREKNMLFCIDEFSVLTDKLQKWDEDQQKQFISKLHQIKQASYPFKHFVMTGFHLDMENLLGSSSSVKSHTLELCDFSTSRPLLKKILETYKFKKASFPLFLFEVVKSTPGLIGYWAELLLQTNKHLDFSYFVHHLIWLKILTKKKVLKTNWLLIFQHLLNQIPDRSNDFQDIGERIVEAEIGTCFPHPEIIPLCFVVIIRKAHQFKIGDGRIQKIILRELNALFPIFETMNLQNETGAPFERLTITALLLRLLLWVQIQTCEDNPEQRIQIPFRSFLPIPEYDSYSGVNPRLNSHFYIHLIREKESLKTLLLAPLYNIFPLGISSLENGWVKNVESSSLTQLIDLLQVAFDLVPYHNNPTISISSKKSEMKQIIICKVDGHEILEDSVVDWYHQMQSGKSYEDINETLTEKAQDWWKYLKDLVNQLKSVIDENYSLISTDDDAEAADLLIFWKEREVIHIAAVELKDQRQTKLSKWKKKWNSLMSPLCILHWMPLFHPDFHFSNHFIFAGREHLGSLQPT